MFEFEILAQLNHELFYQSCCFRLMRSSSRTLDTRTVRPFRPLTQKVYPDLCHQAGPHAAFIRTSSTASWVEGGFLGNHALLMKNTGIPSGCSGIISKTTVGVIPLGLGVWIVHREPALVKRPSRRRHVTGFDLYFH